MISAFSKASFFSANSTLKVMRIQNDAFSTVFTFRGAFSNVCLLDENDSIFGSFYCGPNYDMAKTH